MRLFGDWNKDSLGSFLFCDACWWLFWRDFRFTGESKSLSKMWVFEQQRMGWSDWFAKDATKKSEVASWTCGRKSWFLLRPWSYSCYLSLLLSILITTLKKMEKVQCITSVDSDFTKFSLFEASLSQWFPSFPHLDRSLWDALFTHFGLHNSVSQCITASLL